MARQHKIYPIPQPTPENWQQSFEKARIDQNWEDLLELGKKSLMHSDCQLAIQCFIESRHLHPQEPLTHKYLGEAYKILAANYKKLNHAEQAGEYYSKAKNCYQTAMIIANDTKNTHFLSEYTQEIENVCKELNILLTKL